MRSLRVESSLRTRLIRPWATVLLLTTGVPIVWAESPTETKPKAVPGVTKSAAGFYHPGVLVNRPQLDFIKAKVAAGVEPWKSAYEAAKASDLGTLTYIPHPWKACECGPYSRPDIGCKDEQRDSEAAYTQALLWFISGNDDYAKNAIAIMNAWSCTLKGGHTNSNGPVQAAWCAEQWPRAAEITRYTYDGWSAADVAKFQDMLTTQYVPSLDQRERGKREQRTFDERSINQYWRL